MSGKKIPRKFVLDGREWKVRIHRNVKLRHLILQGLTDPTKREIHIDSALDEAARYATFVHEFLHAVLDAYGLGMNASPPVMSPEEEERLVETLERVLLTKFEMTFKG